MAPARNTRAFFKQRLNVSKLARTLECALRKCWLSSRGNAHCHLIEATRGATQDWIVANGSTLLSSGLMAGCNESSLCCIPIASRRSLPRPNNCHRDAWST